MIFEPLDKGRLIGSLRLVELCTMRGHQIGAGSVGNHLCSGIANCWWQNVEAAVNWFWHCTPLVGHLIGDVVLVLLRRLNAVGVAVIGGGVARPKIIAQGNDMIQKIRAQTAGR